MQCGLPSVLLVTQIYGLKYWKVYKSCHSISRNFFLLIWKLILQKYLFCEILENVPFHRIGVFANGALDERRNLEGLFDFIPDYMPAIAGLKSV